jgi:hypothetical protein
VATAAAKRTLSHARVLADSFLRHHPDVPFFTLLADEVDGYFDPEAEPFRMLRLSELEIPDLARFRSHYSQQELRYATTPYLLAHLLERGFAGAGFLKEESLVVGDLAPILALLGRYSIVLTPHLLEPLTGPRGSARELNILQSGVYNVGFLGVAATPTARAFLSWWQDRVYEHCRHDVPSGMHFEQRWLDLVPAFFEEVHVIRDPGFNVGHWNLPERRVELAGDAMTVGGQPFRFLRLSGFEPERPHVATRYSTRVDLSSMGPVAAQFRRYADLLYAAGYSETKRWRYAYGEGARRARWGRLRAAASRLWQASRGPGGARAALRLVLAAVRRRLARLGWAGR